MAAGVTKVTFITPTKTLDALKRMASDKGITVTEALRQAIENIYFLQNEMAWGNRLLLHSPSGKYYRQVVFRNS